MLTQDEFNLLDKVSLKQSPLEHMTGFELVKFYHAFRKMVVSYPTSQVKSGVRLDEKKESSFQDDMRRS